MCDSIEDQPNGPEGLGSEPKETPAYKDLGDDALMSLVRDADDGLAYTELSLRHREKTFVFFNSKTRSRVTADDLTQEAWTRIWADRKKFRVNAAFRGWLWCLAPTILTNHWANRVPTVPLGNLLSGLFHTSKILNLVLAGEFKERFDAAWKRLTPKERELLKLRYFDEMSSREIALRYGVTERAIWNWLQRAGKRLRDFLLQEYEGSLPDDYLILAAYLEEYPASEVTFEDQEGDTPDQRGGGISKIKGDDPNEYKVG